MRTRPFSRCRRFLHLFLLLSTVFVSFLALAPISQAVTRTVPDQYPTIQAAIDAAAAGDTIQVKRRPGETHSVYYERIVINKQLIVVGESRDNVTIDGNGAGTVVTIQSDSVQFRGFTVRNGGQKYSGIRANSYSYLVIADNAVNNNKQGIVLLNSLDNTVAGNRLFNNSANGMALSQCLGNNISNNDVSESAYGIKATASNTTFVVGNTVKNNSYGIYIDHSTNNTVDGNTLLKNGVDGIFPPYSNNIVISNNNVSESAYGIELYQSQTITVFGNTVTDNSYGIYLAYSSLSNIVEGNAVRSNDWGITLYGSSSNIVRDNTVSLNTCGVYPTEDSNGNQIYHNNLIDNVEQAYWNPYCTNTWDNGYPSGGNYWSDYTGVDGNNDGIGDTPYNIDPSNRDRYPLMTVWAVIHDVGIKSIVFYETKAYAGTIVDITVVVMNVGGGTETFDVKTTFENTTRGITGTIGTQTVHDLSPSEERTLVFNWNTASVQPCVVYTVIAEAVKVPGEENLADNKLTGGQIKIKMPGDVNGDGTVNVEDLSTIARALGTDSSWPSGTGWNEWNPECDINADEKVDIFDLVLAGKNYGTSC